MKALAKYYASGCRKTASGCLEPGLTLLTDSPYWGTHVQSIFQGFRLEPGLNGLKNGRIGYKVGLKKSIDHILGDTTSTYQGNPLIRLILVQDN